MAGKRPRQIHRTTSLSQLGESGMGLGARFSRTAPESFYGGAGAPHTELSPPSKEELFETMEFCAGAEEWVDMEGSMAADGSIEESPFASHAARPGDLHILAPPSSQAPQLLGAPQHALHPSYFVHPALNRPMSGLASFRRSQESGRSAYFLDVCFLCSKRLGHGRDVFIYRGDRAFCSVECRHSQIVADEMREKCAMAAANEGSSGAPATNSTGTSKQVETAAAA